MLACVICSGSGEVNEKIVNFGPCTSCRNCSATETESCAGTWGPVTPVAPLRSHSSQEAPSRHFATVTISTISICKTPRVAEVEETIVLFNVWAREHLDVY